MQQPLPQLGGLFIHCPQNQGRCVHISVSPHRNPQKTRVVFLLYDPTVQALAVTETEDLQRGLQRLWIKHPQSTLLLSPPALPWSTCPSIAPSKEVTKDHESSVVLSAVLCTMYIWCIPPLRSQPPPAKKIHLGSRRPCRHYGH